MTDTSVYQNPLNTRYASREMSHIFSDDYRFGLWRKLWIALAECERELGLNITEEQIEELKAHASDINYEDARRRERECRHDVMSHVYAYGLQCPRAAGIIHLGATSCYVTDNSELLQMFDAMKLVRKKLVNVIDKLSRFALRYKDLPTLGFTHLQPAQLTTVGNRASLWMQDLMLDLEQIEFVLSAFRLRGVKGTTGTQASFLQLFDGDGEKVKQLDRMVAAKFGFDKVFDLTAQPYTRKFDFTVLAALSGVAQSAYKFSNDLRILQNMKEMEEPFEKSQIGSSAMAYKRNPMRSERISALSRFVLSLPANAAVTASTQWFERTLDDSANRRLVVSQAFLAVDAILNIYLNVAENMVVYDKVIRKHIMAELPFMATEVILMECVKAGGNRQELHEAIRVHSMEAARNVKERGLENNLIALLKADPAFAAVRDTIDGILAPENFIGRAPAQVEEYVRDCVSPKLREYAELLGEKGDVQV